MKLTQDGQDSYLLSTDLVKSPLPNILYSGMNMDCQSFFFLVSKLWCCPDFQLTLEAISLDRGRILL